MIRKHRYRKLPMATLLAIALAISACGGQDGADGTTTSPAATSDDSETTAAPEATPQESTSTTTGAESMTVTDFFDVDVEVPSNPEKIIAADDTALGNLLALGVTPVATGVNTLSVPDFLGSQLDGVEDISVEDEPYISRERVLEIEPDLIFQFGADFSEDRCNQLRELATTYCYRYGYVTMDEIRTNLTEVAHALGMDAQGQEIVDDLDARIAEMAQRISDAGLNDQPVSILRVGADWYSVRFGTVPSALMRDLGIARPEDQVSYEDFAFDLSLENLDQIDGYGLFVYVDSDGADDMAALESNPLWERLDVVQNDRVWMVDSGVWNGISVPAAHAILDDIEATFLAGTE